MKNYLKLVNFELNRFFKIYAVLIFITIVSQIAGVIFISRHYLSSANEEIHRNFMSIQEFLQVYGKISFTWITTSEWFVFPILFCIAVLVIYVFFIWYRDWFGKNTFIYRLLMLPTDRLNIYLAKATTIFIMVLGLVALQMILLPLETMIFQMMIPIDFRMDLPLRDIIRSFDDHRVLFPATFLDFVIHYGLGLISVFVVFTAILFERCFKWKGIIIGILYCIGAVTLFFLPGIIILITENSYLYPIEVFILEVVLAIIIMVMSIWISRYLLQNKITV